MGHNKMTIQGGGGVVGGGEVLNLVFCSALIDNFVV